MVKVRFKKHFQNVQLPVKAHDKDAGWDIFVHSVEEKSPGFCIVHTGFSTYIPDDYYMQVVPRSSFTKYNWVLNNSPCTIDPDFLGIWQLRFRGIPTGMLAMETPNYDNFPYQPGDRCAQMILRKKVDMKLEVVDELPGSQRGSGGFGSTGFR